MFASGEERESALGCLEAEVKPERESPLPVDDVKNFTANFEERQGEGSPHKLR